jgi:polysaccharide deacetylase family protein (PEP-CTERM system associated)
MSLSARSESSEPGHLINAMTVDVEDYFQVSAFERHIRREDWDRLECRVERNTERILALFESRGVRATFFMLGWLAERYPQLVRRIVDGGHELASHGYSHVRVTQQQPGQFRGDVSRTKKLLEDISGVPVRGYRAASYSIGAGNLWALDVLREVGYDYSSSIYPIHHDLYGWPAAPRFAFHHRETGLIEIPVTTVEFFERKFPCGGGGYFRLFPYAVSRWALRRVNRHDREPCVFYFHPWEIDADQPRQTNLGLKTRFRHYLNLGRMEQRLARLLQDFRWGRMDQVFLASRQDHP